MNDRGVGPRSRCGRPRSFDCGVCFALGNYIFHSRSDLLVDLRLPAPPRAKTSKCDFICCDQHHREHTSGRIVIYWLWHLSIPSRVLVTTPTSVSKQIWVQPQTGTTSPAAYALLLSVCNWVSSKLSATAEFYIWCKLLLKTSSVVIFLGGDTEFRVSRCSGASQLNA